MTADLEEEVWRLPQTARGRDTRLGTRSGSDHPPSLSPAAKARLSRIVRRTPEVMVKITGRSRGIVHLKQHLDYITRNGRLLAELQDGTKIETRADLRDFARRLARGECPDGEEPSEPERGAVGRHHPVDAGGHAAGPPPRRGPDLGTRDTGQS